MSQEDIYRLLVRNPGKWFSTEDIAMELGRDGKNGITRQMRQLSRFVKDVRLEIVRMNETQGFQVAYFGSGT